MVTLSFSMWELAVLIIAIAIVFGTVQLVKVLKNLTETLANANKIMDENRSQFKNIVDNTSDITANSSDVIKDVKDTVDTVNADIVAPVMDGTKKVVSIINSVGKVNTRVAKRKDKSQKKQARKTQGRHAA